MVKTLPAGVMRPMYYYSSYAKGLCTWTQGGDHSLAVQNYIHSSEQVVCMQVFYRLLSKENIVTSAILTGPMAAVVQALQKRKHAFALNVISAAMEASHKDDAQHQTLKDGFRLWSACRF